MKIAGFAIAAFLAAAPLGGAAFAANMCQAGKLSCATTMPVGGFCQCTSGGATESGTVTEDAAPARPNSTAGGCGANPSAPGCTGGGAAPR